MSNRIFLFCCLSIMTQVWLTKPSLELPPLHWSLFYMHMGVISQREQFQAGIWSKENSLKYSLNNQKGFD